MLAGSCTKSSVPGHRTFSFRLGLGLHGGARLRGEVEAQGIHLPRRVADWVLVPRLGAGQTQVQLSEAAGWLPRQVPLARRSLQ